MECLSFLENNFVCYHSLLKLEAVLRISDRDFLYSAGEEEIFNTIIASEEIVRHTHVCESVRWACLEKAQEVTRWCVRPLSIYSTQKMQQKQRKEVVSRWAALLLNKTATC